MNAIYQSLPVLLVFLTLGAFSWIWGGSKAEPLMNVAPWVLAFAAETLFFLPQRRPMEDSYSARRRVAHALARDPLTYVALTFVVLLVIPLFNRGLCPVCDYPAIMKGASVKPPVPFFPFCVSVTEHYETLQWFVPAFMVMLACRHALVREGKRLMLELALWNAALLAVFGFIERGTGAVWPYWTHPNHPWPIEFFSTFGYPNMGGSFFAMAYAIGIGIWFHRQNEVASAHHHSHHQGEGRRERYLWLKAHYPLIPTVLCFFGALCTFSRAAILLVIAFTALAFAYLVFGLFAKRKRTERVKLTAWAGFGLLLLWLAAMVFAPARVSKEMNSLSSFAVLDRVSGKGQYHTRVATAIFKEYPFFGVGGWGYAHFAPQYIKPEDGRDPFEMGGANVHNDYLQFLCEHGVVGFGLLLAAVVLALAPTLKRWHQLYHTALFASGSARPAKPIAIYALPAGSFWTLLAALAVGVHAFGDCPLRSAAVLVQLFMVLPCAAGYLPHEEE